MRARHLRERESAPGDGSAHGAIAPDRRSPAAVGQTPPSVPQEPLHTRYGRGTYVAYWREVVIQGGSGDGERKGYLCMGAGAGAENGERTGADGAGVRVPFMGR